MICLAVVPREKPHTGAAAREQTRDSPVIEMLFSTVSFLVHIGSPHKPL